MGSSTNRSLAVKNDKAKAGRIERGQVLAAQFATMVTRHIPKSELRGLAASAQHMVKSATLPHIEAVPADRPMVLFRSTQVRTVKLTALQAAWAPIGSCELIKRK